ncbi:hypothetical protein ABZ845_12375 [Streptomyces sp. NPDC047022]|uniref:hypothetical protein n=1 Tax=Streptomyces sp. NPDC047022 TaxID=3155737 RepID=UPI0033C9A4FE
MTGEHDARVPVGVCPTVNEDTGMVCGERLRVSPWAFTLRCGACAASWARDEWLRLGARLRGLQPPPTAA